MTLSSGIKGSNGQEWDASHGSGGGGGGGGGSPAGAARKQFLEQGNMYWGAAGHRGRAPYNTTISLAKQISDLQNIFGTTPNTIVYRALGEEEFNTVGAVNSDVVALQAANIIPIVQVYTFPDWTQWATEAASYAAANAAVKANVQAASTNLVWEIGNEWVLQSIHAQMLNDGSKASDWNTAPLYPIYRGAMAGAIAAVRDFGPAGSQIIGGALAGWTFQGLSLAFAADLLSYTPQGGRNLTWDVEVEHTYDDTTFPNNNQIPDPGNFNGGMSYFVLQKSVGKPIFFTEFGSSTNNVPANNADAATRLTTQMDAFLTHQPTTAIETGCMGGCVYQLYQTADLSSQAELGYFLYTWSAANPAVTTISPQGTAVKNWIIAHPPGATATTTTTGGDGGLYGAGGGGGAGGVGGNGAQGLLVISNIPISTGLIWVDAQVYNLFSD